MSRFLPLVQSAGWDQASALREGFEQGGGFYSGGEAGGREDGDVVVLTEGEDAGQNRLRRDGLPKLTKEFERAAPLGRLALVEVAGWSITELSVGS